MDHDKWVAQSCSGSLEGTDSKEESVTSRSSTPTKKQSKSVETSNRYVHDMAQAKLMRRLRPTAGESSDVTAEDLSLGLKGLDQAKAYQRKGQLEESLKLYELSIELLIRYLKDAEDGIDRSSTQAKVGAALSDAEAIKTSLGARHKPPSPPQKQSSFQSLTNALASALGGSKPKQNSPTSAVVPTTRARPMPQQVQPRPQTSRRPANNNAIATKRPTRISPTSTTTHTNAANELRQTVLSDFYVSPTDLQKTTWSDVAGLENVKQALQETAILPLIRPDLFTGLRRPQNILLWGPPGTGKTLLVRAVAYESGSNLFAITSSALTSKWLGEAEKLVRTLFQVARELAPSILFLDEMDALLSSRKSDGEHEASRRLKIEFMIQMEGITTTATNERHLLLIACTNCPWDIDPAVLRRFPRRILVPLPDSEARRGIIEYLLKKAGKHSLTSRHITTLVKRTEGFSCSDITAIASEASFGPLRSLGDMDAIKGIAAADVRPVQLKDFETVIDQTTKSISATQLKRYEQWQKEQAS